MSTREEFEPEVAEFIRRHHPTMFDTELIEALQKEMGVYIPKTSLRTWRFAHGVNDKTIRRHCIECGREFTTRRHRTIAGCCSEKCRDVRAKRSRERYERIHGDVKKVRTPPKRKTPEAEALNEVERQRKSEGKYFTYGTYVAAKECQIRIVFPDWVKLIRR